MPKFAGWRQIQGGIRRDTISGKMKCVRESRSLMMVYHHVSEQASQWNLLQERAL